MHSTSKCPFGLLYCRHKFLPATQRQRLQCKPTATPTFTPSCAHNLFVTRDYYPTFLYSNYRDYIFPNIIYSIVSTYWFPNYLFLVPPLILYHEFPHHFNLLNGRHRHPQHSSHHAAISLPRIECKINPFLFSQYLRVPFRILILVNLFSS